MLAVALVFMTCRGASLVLSLVHSKATWTLGSSSKRRLQLPVHSRGELCSGWRLYPRIRSCKAPPMCVWLLMGLLHLWYPTCMFGECCKLDKCEQREICSEQHCCHPEYRPDTKWEVVVLVREWGTLGRAFGAVAEAVKFASRSCQIGVYDACDINYYL